MTIFKIAISTPFNSIQHLQQQASRKQVFYLAFLYSTCKRIGCQNELLTSNVKTVLKIFRGLFARCVSIKQHKRQSVITPNQNSCNDLRRFCSAGWREALSFEKAISRG